MAVAAFWSSDYRAASIATRHISCELISGSHPESALPLIQPSLVLVYSHALTTDFPELQAVLVLTKTGCKQVPDQVILVDDEIVQLIILFDA